MGGFILEVHAEVKFPHSVLLNSTEIVGSLCSLLKHHSHDPCVVLQLFTIGNILDLFYSVLADRKLLVVL